MSSCTSQAKSGAPDFAPRPRITIHRFAAILLVTLAFALAFVFGISQFLSANQWLSQQRLGTTWRNACYVMMDQSRLTAANTRTYVTDANTTPNNHVDLTRHCLMG